MKRRAAAPSGLHIESYVPSLVNRAAMAMLTYSAVEFEKLGLTVPQWRILLALSQHHICRFGELAKLTSIEPSTLSRLLDAMSKGQWVKRERTEEDTRNVNVSMTARGMALFRKSVPFAETVNNAYVDGISAADLAALRRALTRISTNVERMRLGRTSAKRSSRRGVPG